MYWSDGQLRVICIETDQGPKMDPWENPSSGGGLFEMSTLRGMSTDRRNQEVKGEKVPLSFSQPLLQSCP